MIEETFVPQTFGKWTTIGPTFTKRDGSGTMRAFVPCRCVCGKIKEICLRSLRRGKSTGCLSCGKITNSWSLGARHPDPAVRLTALSRQSRIRCCYDPTYKGYVYYGGRNPPVTMCDRWLDPINGLKHFIEDMGLRPSIEFKLDRIDNDGNYTPENCRWATDEQQANNRRNNRKITWNGMTKTVSQWAKFLGVSRNLLFDRLNKLKWPVDRALSTPVKKQAK